MIDPAPLTVIDAFVDATRRVTDWTAPALGEWSVRALVTHMARVFTLTMNGLRAPVPGPIDCPSVGEYYARFRRRPGADAEVAATARAHADSLGDDPVATLVAWRDDMLDALSHEAPDRPIATPNGVASLRTFFDVRVVELGCHLLDLEPSAVLPDTVGPVVVAAMSSFATPNENADLLMAMLGRRGLPEGFSVFSPWPAVVPVVADARLGMAEAGASLKALVAQITADQWEAPGLGVWTMRETLAHLLRAFSTIEAYLDAPPSDVVFASATEYFRSALGAAGTHEGVAARARDAATALVEPGRSTVAIVDSALDRIARTSDDVLCSPFGRSLPLGEYLKTRVVEATAHTLDLADAVGRTVELSAAGLSESISVVAGVASASQVASMIRAAGGRGALPIGFNVFS